MKYNIKRIIEGTEVSIPLTEEEMQGVYRMIDKKNGQDFLTDEIYDLDENDDCFSGYSQDELTKKDEFLNAVEALWDKYNGHGGDRTENLREAVSVVTSRMKGGLNP